MRPRPATVAAPDPGAVAAAVVRERFGLVVHPHQRAGFERALAAAARALAYPDRDAYVEALRSAPANAPEVERLLECVTVGESYFFRDAAQVEFLREHWIPALVERRGAGARRVRVWSAGCSRGQEIYTVAMLLDAGLPESDVWRMELLGTDINPAALAAAREGVYREWSMRATPDEARRRWFEPRPGGGWRISERLRSRVRFERLNLADLGAGRAASPAAERFDLVLCRNVFIYFDRRVVAEVLAHFARALAPRGVLLLGPADVVAERTPGLCARVWGPAQVLVRSAETEGDAAPAPTPRAAPAPRTRVPTPPLGSAPGLPEPTAGAPATAAAPPPAGAPTGEPPSERSVADLLAREAWEAAVTAAEARLDACGPSAAMLVAKARALASLGRREAARAAALAAVEHDPLRADAHFILGLALAEDGEHDAAEASLRRAIFLDRDLLAAHHQLGRLLRGRGRVEAALRSLRNALALAEQAPPDATPALAEAITYGEIAAGLRLELGLAGSGAA